METFCKYLILTNNNHDVNFEIGDLVRTIEAKFRQRIEYATVKIIAFQFLEMYSDPYEVEISGFRLNQNIYNRTEFNRVKNLYSAIRPTDSGINDANRIILHATKDGDSVIIDFQLISEICEVLSNFPNLQISVEKMSCFRNENSVTEICFYNLYQGYISLQATFLVLKTDRSIRNLVDITKIELPDLNSANVDFLAFQKGRKISLLTVPEAPISDYLRENIKPVEDNVSRIFIASFDRDIGSDRKMNFAEISQIVTFLSSFENVFSIEAISSINEPTEDFLELTF